MTDLPLNLNDIMEDQKTDSAKYVMMFPKNTAAPFFNQMSTFNELEGRMQMTNFDAQFSRSLLYNKKGCSQMNKVTMNQNYFHAHYAPRNPLRRSIIPSQKVLNIRMDRSRKHKYQQLMKTASGKNCLNVLNDNEISNLQKIIAATQPIQAVLQFQSLQYVAQKFLPFENIKSSIVQDVVLGDQIPVRSTLQADVKVLEQ